MQSLYELLQSCTVKLSIRDKKHGTGFFVAPDFILTCAHVVRDVDKQCIKDDIKVKWQNQKYFAKAEDKYFFNDCDVALVKLTSSISSHPCVYLDELVEAYDELYSYGYPDDFDKGAPVTFECEGITGDNPPFIKFKEGQARPGLSGSPLLNKRTKKVCGIVKFSRDRSSDLGGGGVLMTTVFSQLTELKEQNHQFHEQNNRWKSLVESLGYNNLPNPNKVSNIESSSNSRKKYYEKRLAAKREELEAIESQSEETLSNIDELKLNKQAERLLKEIEELEAKLNY